MAVIGVSITKRYVWEGEPEEFSNVYHYTDPALILDPPISESDARALVDIIVAEEKTIHAADVEFVRARVWGPTDGTQEENETIAIFDLNTQGTGSIDSSMCLEDCILVRTLTRRESVRGRPVWLRKWYRTMQNPVETDGNFATDVHRRVAQMPQATMDLVRGTMESLANVNLIEFSSFPDTLILSSPSGRRIKELGEREFEVYSYLQTHDVKY